MTRIHLAVLVLVASSCADLGLAQEPVPLEIAAPSYPKIPPGAEESGDVQIEVSINTLGRVVSAKAISGPQRLRTAATFAAKQWKFQQREKPTDVWVLTFSFIYRAGVGDPPSITSVFKPPNRVEVYALERKVVVLQDPPVGVVKKSRK